jgi:hypothetical protein
LNSELNKNERKRQEKLETPGLLCIDSQSVKTVAFINRAKALMATNISMAALMR